MRRQAAWLILPLLLVAGCADVSGDTAAAPPIPSTVRAEATKPSPAAVVVPQALAESPSPAPVKPSRPVVVVPPVAAELPSEVPALVPPVVDPPIQPPAYVAPFVDPPVQRPVYVAAPVTQGDAVTVPVRPPCPTGSVETTIGDVKAVVARYQSGLSNSLRYDLTITGTIVNHATQEVRLAAFRPLTVEVSGSYTDTRLDSFFSTIRPGGSIRWTATSAWTQYSKYSKPQVTAKTTGWKWADDLYSDCSAGSFF